MNTPPDTYDDVRLEVIRKAASECDDQRLASFLSEHEGVAPFDLAGLIIRDFFGKVDIAWLLDTLYEARKIAREQREENGEVTVAGPYAPKPEIASEAMAFEQIERLHEALEVTR